MPLVRKRIIIISYHARTGSRVEQAHCIRVGLDQCSWVRAGTHGVHAPYFAADCHTGTRLMWQVPICGGCWLSFQPLILLGSRPPIPSLVVRCLLGVPRLGSEWHHSSIRSSCSTGRGGKSVTLLGPGFHGSGSCFLI